MPPARLGAELDAALEAATRDGDYLALLFHPYLTEPEERFAILRGALRRVRELADADAVWCAPCRDVAASLELGEPRADDPRALHERPELGEREVTREVLHPAVGADL